MLAYRTTWIVKLGRMQEALTLLKEEAERVGAGEARNAPGVGVGRIYTPSISPNALIFETTFENTAAHEAFWAMYDGDSPEAKAFWTSWYDVVERNAGTEIWTLTEWR
jgi:hypothetical protein